MVDSTDQQIPDNPDMASHLRNLEENDKLVKIDKELNKDTEIHPFVRWQYRGNVSAEERKAFLFTNVTDSKGRDYDIPVTVGALAGSPEIYALGLGTDPAKSHERWDYAYENQIEPAEIDSDDAPVHDIVYSGSDLEQDGQALDGVPVPVSTPGWDNAPYTTASYVITHHPETGKRNIGNYRAQIKTRTRTGLNPHPTLGQGAYQHWKIAKERGEDLPVAICPTAAPCVGFASIQNLPYETDELAVAGGLVDRQLREVEAVTQPVMVPADADIVIEGKMRTDVLEPEAPFGESHGHMNAKQYNPIIEVTGITRREDAVYTSIISQLTPSESSCMKVAPFESLLLKHLQEDIGVTSVKDVGLHEPLTSLRKVTVIQMEEDAMPGEIWRAMRGAMTFRNDFSKFTVAVDEDIDPKNLDAVFWAIGYRAKPHKDARIIDKKDVGHVPRYEIAEEEMDAAILIDATLKDSLPPVSLPKKEYMERGRELWDELKDDLGLPEVTPESPWYGYSLGQWNDRLDLEAKRAVESEYFETGKELEEQRVSSDEAEINESVYNPEEYDQETIYDPDN